MKFFWAKLENNDYIFSAISRIIQVIGSLCYSILFSRYFQASLRGIYSVLSTYIELAVLVLCMGMYQAYPYYKRRTDYNIYIEFINIILAIFIFYGAIAFVGIIIFWKAIECRIALFLIPFMFVTQELNYVVLIENPKIRNISATLLCVFDNLLIFMFMLFFKTEIQVLFIFLILKEITYFIVAIKSLKIDLKDIHPSFQRANKYIKFGFLPMITVFMMDLNYKADIVMLDYFCIEKKEIGIYSLGVSLAQKIWAIPDSLKDILLSKLAKGSKEEEVCKIIRYSLWIVILCAIVLIICGRLFINIFYGSVYTSSYYVMFISLLGVIGMVFYKMIYSYNVINGKQKVNLFILGLSAGLNLIINYFTIPQLSIIGAAYASTISYTFCGLGFLWYFLHETNIKVQNTLFLNKTDIKTIQKLLKNKK